MSSWFATWLALGFLLPSEPQGREVARFAAAIRHLGATRGFPVPPHRARRLAELFLRYGRRWHVNPYLVASVACRESGFRLRPRAVAVRRCRTSFAGGRAVQHCGLVPGKERGILQILPSSALAGLTACGHRRRRVADALLDPETNICVGTWLLARRRARILRRLRRRRPFAVRGGRAQWALRHAPCSPKQHRFCRRHPWVCERFWWVAAHNWGSHQLLCGPTGRGYDFQGYPIRVLGLFLEAAATDPRAWTSSPEDLEYARYFPRSSFWTIDGFVVAAVGLASRQPFTAWPFP